METIATNSIILGEDTGGKGRVFQSRFLQAGLVKYSFGVCLLTKETINKFVNTFIGCPVRIDHKDITDENAKDERVGVVSDIWFNDGDGWFWCKGVIFDDKAIELINNGYNVSCQYEITEYSDNIENKLHNGMQYDKEILNGKFEHLAIVDNPRYEGALIAVNAINKAENGFITIDAGTENERVIWVPRDLLTGKAAERIMNIANNYKEGEHTKYDFSHTRIKPTTEQLNYIKNTVNEVQAQYKFKGLAQIEISSELNSGSLGCCVSPDNCSVVSLSPRLYSGKYDQARYDDSVKRGFHPKGTGEMIKSVMVHELGHAITVNSNNKPFWDEIDDIRKSYLKEIKKTDINNPDFISNYARSNKYEFVAEAFCQGMLAKKYGKYTKQVMNTIDKHFKSQYQTKLFNARNEEKEDIKDMWIEEYGLGYPIDERSIKDYERNLKKRKATNEYKPILDYIENYDERNETMNEETKNVFERLISALKAKNEADEKDKKAENEDVDKRDIIRQIMAIAGKEEASEDVKTIAKLAEKLAYDKSEAGTADNKAKNEDKEDKDKEADNKAKNDKVDKRELIDQVGGILKGKVDDEIIRTVIGKLEEIAYDKSEAGTADNKAKNDDDEYKKLKDDVEKDVENCKAKNSMDALKELFYTGDVRSEKSYMSQKERIELGKKLF